MARIPVAIITGFLGSGKTTLLNRALRQPEFARSAVVINEFGEIGIDHALVTASDDSVVLLENGCLCCTVRGDLVATLDQIHRRRGRGEMAFDRVLIETSGLADPAPVLQAFLSEPTLAARYRVGTVMATVDAVNGHATLDAHVEAVRQAALADDLLITKLDLVAPADAAAAEASLRARLGRLNPGAAITRADVSSLPGLLRNADLDPFARTEGARRWLRGEAFAPGGHHHHGSDADDGCAHAGPFDRQIASYCIVREEPLRRDTVQLLLDGLSQNLGPKLLRVKGLLHIAEEPDRPAVIQGAQQLLHTLSWLDRWPDEDRRSRLVFITEGAGRELVEDMIALLDRIAARTARARATARSD
ncbi:MAG: CobW family GTP-binding protein [Xanthobacteraceae bacterium]